MATRDRAGDLTHRVLLTGSSGTLGYYIMLQLLESQGATLLAVHRQKPVDLPLSRKVRHVVIDFEKKREWSQLFRQFRPTCVIHCAASGMIFPHVQWFKLLRFNVDFTLFLFELTARLGTGSHFIHVSTGLAYRSTGNPLRETDAMDNIHPYGASKAAVDILLRSGAVEFGLPLTLFRPFSFTGLRDNRTRLFPSILRAAVENKPLALSPGEQIRDFCSARDIARGILLALLQAPSARQPAVYNLGSGNSLPLRRVIEDIVEQLDIPVTLRFGVNPYGPFEPMHLVADISQARQHLRWQPRHRLAHAVWQLAQASFPRLKLKKPPEHL